MRARPPILDSLITRPWDHADHVRPDGPYRGDDPDAINGVPLVYCDDCRRWFQTGTLLVHNIITHAPAYSKGSVEMRSEEAA